MSLNILELLEEKRKELTSDSDYIEELERLVEVGHEATVNLEKIVHQSLTKIQIDHSKVTNLPTISFEDKIIIGEQIDEDDKLKTVLWLERSNLRGKDRICLNGAAYSRTSLNNEFVMQKADVLGYHQINKNGEETIKSSIAHYNVKSLYELIIH